MAGKPPRSGQRPFPVLTRATPVLREGSELGRLVAVDIDAADRTIVAITGRQHWWSRRFTIAGGALDFTTPGAIRTQATRDTRAA